MQILWPRMTTPSLTLVPLRQKLTTVSLHAMRAFGRTAHETSCMICILHHSESMTDDPEAEVCPAEIDGCSPLCSQCADVRNDVPYYGGVCCTYSNCHKACCCARDCSRIFELGTPVGTPKRNATCLIQKKKCRELHQNKNQRTLKMTGKEVTSMTCQ